MISSIRASSERACEGAAHWIARALAALVLLAISAGAPPVSKGQGADACSDRLRSLVEAKMKELRAPGAVVFVDVPGACRWVATLGVRDLTRNRPMSLDDHVRIGSITKTFTGTAVLQLVDDRLVKLDDPISRYVSGVPNGANITVRQLLHMSSGLYNYSEDLEFNRTLDTNPQKIWMRRELLAIGFGHDPYFSPGAGFHYSNTNSVLLGRLVEAVTGDFLEDVFRRRIFRPLRMRETSLPEADDARVPRPHPRGYMFGTNVGTLPPDCDAAKVGPRDVTNASPSWTWAAGGAISTLADLKIWARALAKGTLLSAGTQAQRLDFIPTAPSPGAPGYGLHITSFGGILGHDGALPGFQSFMGYLPSRDATLIVLTNLYPDIECGGPADEIAKVILAELKLIGP